MRNQYYYFVTGLPALSIDDSKSSITPEQFLSDAKTHLSTKDYSLLLLLCLPDDIDDLLRIIYKKTDEGKPINECSLFFWQTYVEQIKLKAADSANHIGKDYQVYPDYLHRICLGIFSAEEMPSYLETQHQLLELVYQDNSRIGSKFLSQWFAYNRDMQNILIAINGRHHNFPFAKYLIGHDDLTEKLSKSHAADFGMGKDNEVFESLLRNWEQNNILYRERGYDILRWKWIDDHNFFSYFNIDRILGYYAQLRILNRWLSMDPALGKELLQDALDNMTSSFTFPEQFNVKSLSKK